MLQEIRLKTGLSQSQLSEKSGVKLGMIQFYEQGYRDINHAKLETLCKIAEALNCPISSILSDEELITKCKTVKL